MADERIGASFSIDITDLKAGIELANKLIRESQSEFKAAAAGLDDWSKSEEGLNAKIKSLSDITEIQKKKVEALKTEYKNLIDKGLDPTSKYAVELRTRINDTEAALRSNEAELKKQQEALKKVGKESDKTGKYVEKFGELAKTAGKVAAAAFSVAAAGIAALTKNALGNFADYEQLVGGVETLFKDSADIVQNYANNAYKTAGLSANEYMETVTSFSASLLQSLGGDTEKAAQIADMAISDMSDNANKMGTSIESIQNAYGGFAKQTFTMLDNLKLGYGGTKEEMQRLLDDAGELSGIEYNLSSYADIVNAIHVIQNEMGITGTTAKEASTTIQGSLSATKSAWANLMTGIADEKANIDGLIVNLIDSITTVISNVMPRIRVIIKGIIKMTEELLPEIPPLIADLLPEILEGATELINGIIDILPQLIDAVIEILPQLVRAILGMLPSLLNATIQIILAIIDGIGKMLPDIVDAIMEIVPQLINTLTEAIPQLTEASFKFLFALVDAIPLIIKSLVKVLPDIVSAIVETLISNQGMLIEGAIQLLFAIVQAIPQIVTELQKAVPQIIKGIVEGLIEGAPKLYDNAKEIFGHFWNGIIETFEGLGTWFDENVIGTVGKYFNGLWDNVKGGAKKAWEGIKEVFGTAGNFFKDTFTKAWTKVKDVFSAGGKIFDGIKDGIVTAFKTVVNAIITGINKVVSIPFKGLNTVLDKIQGVEIAGVKPFDWIKWRAPIPEIPKLAKGGVVRKATTAIVGEEGDEAIIPLEKNKQWIMEIAKEIAKEMPKNQKQSVTVNQTNNYSQAHSRYELYKSKVETEAAVRLALEGT